MNITEFLLARIVEDEAEAGSGWSTLGDTRWDRDNYGRTMLTPSAILAECAAKRAIIVYSPPKTLQYLAAVYAEHPGYQQEWAL